MTWAVNSGLRVNEIAGNGCNTGIWSDSGVGITAYKLNERNFMDIVHPVSLDRQEMLGGV